MVPGCTLSFILCRWSAVAKGAVIAMLKGYGGTDALSSRRMPSVVSRVSRFSYGVQSRQKILNVNPPYDPSKDREYYDPDGSKKIKRMRWYLKTVRFKFPWIVSRSLC